MSGILEFSRQRIRAARFNRYQRKRRPSLPRLAAIKGAWALRAPLFLRERCAPRSEP